MTGVIQPGGIKPGGIEAGPGRGDPHPAGNQWQGWQQPGQPTGPQGWQQPGQPTGPQGWQQPGQPTGPQGLAAARSTHRPARAGSSPVSPPARKAGSSRQPTGPQGWQQPAPTQGWPQQPGLQQPGPQQAPPPAQTPKSRTPIIVTAIAVVVALLAGAGVWFFAIRDTQSASGQASPQAGGHRALHLAEQLGPDRARRSARPGRGLTVHRPERRRAVRTQAARRARADCVRDLVDRHHRSPSRDSPSTRPTRRSTTTCASSS